MYSDVWLWIVILFFLKQRITIHYNPLRLITIDHNPLKFVSVDK